MLSWNNKLIINAMMCILTLTMTNEAQAETSQLSVSETVTKSEIAEEVQLNTYFQGEDRITGIVGSNVKKVRLYKGNKFMRTGTIYPDKTFAVYVRDFHPTRKGNWKLITVDGDDKSGRITDIDVKHTNTNLITLDEFVEGDTYLTGKATEGTSAIRLYANSKEQRAVKVQANGTFKLYTLDLKLIEGDQLEVFALDVDKKEGLVLETVVSNFIPNKAPNMYATASGDSKWFGSQYDHSPSENPFRGYFDDDAKYRFYINGKYIQTVGYENEPPGMNLRSRSISVTIPEEYRDSDTAIFELVVVDERNREGERSIDKPHIGLVRYNWIDRYKLYTQPGRGTNQIKIKDKNGVNILTINKSEFASKYILLDKSVFQIGEKYYIYGVDSKGNLGARSEFIMNSYDVRID